MIDKTDLENVVARNGGSIFYIISEMPHPCGRGENYYKLGITGNHLAKRLSELQTGNPSNLYVVYYTELPNVKQFEKDIHQKYIDRCIRGEWFNLSHVELFGIILEAELCQVKWQGGADLVSFEDTIACGKTAHLTLCDIFMCDLDDSNAEAEQLPEG